MFDRFAKNKYMLQTLLKYQLYKYYVNDKCFSIID